MHKELIRDIKTVGDEQFRVTNLKAQTTRWNMAKDFKSFKELLDIIVKHHLKYYIQDGPFMGNLDVVCPDMWGSIYKKGDYAIEHSHNPADISFVYYVKAIEETSKIINAGNLRCEYDEFGNCKSVNICSGSSMLTPYEDDCLFEEQERAWSSPIFVDYKKY